jgi:hypothetical protein
MVGVDWYIRIGQEDLQAGTTLMGVGQGLGQGAAGQEGFTLEVSIDPLEEGIDQRFAVGLPVILKTAFAR